MLDKMCRYEMDPVSIVEDAERTQFCPQTEDRRTVGQGETGIPPPPPPPPPPLQLRWAVGYTETGIGDIHRYLNITTTKCHVCAQF